jgi:hypothetical protein
MKRVVLVFGLLAGAVLSVMLVVQTAFIDEIGFDRGEIIGYTTMVLAFLMIYFGIRSYRDHVYGGTITFWKAVGVGLGITLVASACYVTTWEVIYFWFAPDFIEKYGVYVVEKAREGGASQQELAAKAAEWARYKKMFKNPLINAGITFIDVLPVGLVITLVSAAILRRDRRPTGHTPALPSTAVRE